MLKFFAGSRAAAETALLQVPPFFWPGCAKIQRYRRHRMGSKKKRGRLARKHFSPGAHPAAETPFCIAAASVSARGDAQCVWSHESSSSSSYERKHGSARSHIFTSVKTTRVKLVKLETNYKQKEKQPIAKLTYRPQFLQSTLAQLSSVQDGSAQLGSVKVGSTQATFREWLCATGSVQVGSARACSAQCALHELRRAISHESGLRKLRCSRLLRSSCSLQAAARKCFVQVALRGIAKAPRDSFQRPFREQQNRTAPQREASTRTISADGSPRLRRIRTAPQRKRFNTHNLRRGFIRECQKRTKPRVFAPRPRRSPQRVAFPIAGNIPTPRLKRDYEYRALSHSLPRVKYLT